MKSIYTTAILCLFGLSVFAQDSLSVRDTEISINVNNFVSRYLSFSDTQENISDPYTFMLHRQMTGGKSYLRLGLGLDLRYSNDKNEDSGTTNDERTTLGFATNLRFGAERRKMIHSKFRLHYGSDVVLGVNYFKTENEQNSTFESTGSGFEVGYGPVVGLSFLINDRVSIWTEATMYLTYSRFKQESSFNNQNADTSISSEVLFDIREPLSINLKIKL